MSDEHNVADPRDRSIARRAGWGATEVLSPAGDFECMKAAVLNGADAVYFGLRSFNARIRASNFETRTLRDTFRYLHDHNVRGYLTLNTLAFYHELEAVEEMLALAAAAGADAVIVQDLGVAALSSRVCPTMPVHASTQMALCHQDAVRAAAATGIRRVILPRELSIDQATQFAGLAGIEAEIFVHGALCVSVGGQCLASEGMGGRSANRGECAQPCRLSWGLRVNGRETDTGRRRYLMSPRDLCTVDLVPELVQRGFAALKIEGRLKGPEYVAAVTRLYRNAVDAAMQGKAAEGLSRIRADAEILFSRGLCDGHLKGGGRTGLVDGLRQGGHGLFAGRVEAVEGGRVSVRPDPACIDGIRPGDGLLFEDESSGSRTGGRVTAVERAGNSVDGILVLQVRRSDEGPWIIPGSLVFKTGDPEVSKRWRSTCARDAVFRPVPIRVSISAQAGGPVVATATDPEGRSATARWEGPAQPARSSPLTQSIASERMGKLGGTPFALAALDLEAGEPVMVPMSVLSDLKRELASSLLAMREPACARDAPERGALALLRAERPQAGPVPSAEKSGLGAAAIAEKLAVVAVARTEDQARAIVEWSVNYSGISAAIAFEFPPGVDRKPWAEAARAAGIETGAAMPRIVLPGEEQEAAEFLKDGDDFALLRSLSELRIARAAAPAAKLVADAALNAANDLSAEFLLSLGFTSVTPGLDLSIDEALPMIRAVGGHRFEFPVYLHLPMFHCVHCPAARFAGCGAKEGLGTCARGVELVDRARLRHPVLADRFCRSTVFRGPAQSAVRRLCDLQAAGVRRFRIEFLREDSGTARRVLDAHSDVLLGAAQAGDAWSRLRSLRGTKVTPGSFGS